MAYGKQVKDLNNVPSFRRALHQQRKNAPATQTTGSKYFVDRFNPSITTPDTIRILRQSFTVPTPDYGGNLVDQTLPYFPYVSHFHARYKQSFICSGGPFHNQRDKREKCFGCDTYESEKSAQTQTVSKRTMYAFSVLHYAPYAYAPRVDKTGAPIICRKTNEPFRTWVRVLPHEKSKYANCKMRSAHVLHWSVGFGHMSVLEEFDRIISDSCKNCGGESCLSSEAWSCPSCGEIIIDMNSTELDQNAIEDLVYEPVKCPSCQNIGMLHEHVQCKHCDNGIRADMFDVDLTLKRTKPSDNSTQNLLTVIKYSAPRPIDPLYKDIAVPLDLPDIFKPDPTQKQQALFRFTPETPQFKPYGEQAEDDEDVIPF